MRNIKLIIEYDGTEYHGWQRQPELATIQEEVEKAIYQVTKEKVEVIGSSRTDAGVHAKGFVANFKTESRVPSNKFNEALNIKLPDDISIIKSEEVNAEFHSRFDAKGKTYEYVLLNRRAQGALMRGYNYHVKFDLNFEEMIKACEYFKGTHDFIGFKSQGGSAKTTTRTIYDLKLEKIEDFIKISITGDGFLYNMVRIIVGTLIDVGRGRIRSSEIEELILKKDRNLAGPCVPARGLVLKEVYY